MKTSIIFQSIDQKLTSDNFEFSSNPFIVPLFSHIINEFSTWLEKETVFRIEWYILDEDWVMKRKNDVVKFNCFLLIKSRSVKHFVTVLVHEFYHLVQNNLSNKSDVKNLKDSFNDLTMRIIDIEADVVTAKFLNEKVNFGFGDFFTTMYEGQKIFKDSEIRTGKFERFLGSIISIYASLKTKSKIILTPSSNNFFISNKLQVLVIKNNMHSFNTIKVSSVLMKQLQEAYQNSDKMTCENYLNIVKNFAEKVFNQLGIKKE